MTRGRYTLGGALIGFFAAYVAAVTLTPLVLLVLLFVGIALVSVHQTVPIGTERETTKWLTTTTNETK